MFVGSDGKFYGTVGGGCTEAEVWQEARKVIKTGMAKLLHYTMDGKQLEDEGMICGGNVDIFVEPVAEKYRALYGAIPDLERQGTGALLVTKFSDQGFWKSLVKEDGTVSGDPIDEGMRADFQRYVCEKRPIVLGNTIIRCRELYTTLQLSDSLEVTWRVQNGATCKPMCRYFVRSSPRQF